MIMPDRCPHCDNYPVIAIGREYVSVVCNCGVRGKAFKSTDNKIAACTHAVMWWHHYRRFLLPARPPREGERVCNANCSEYSSKELLARDNKEESK